VQGEDGLLFGVFMVEPGGITTTLFNLAPLDSGRVAGLAGSEWRVVGSTCSPVSADVRCVYTETTSVSDCVSVSASSISSLTEMRPSWSEGK
jgi:hypothetical protein